MDGADGVDGRALLGRRLGWAGVGLLASWPWAVSYMIAYAPEESGLDFEPPVVVFWLYLATALVVAIAGWRAGARARRAGPRLRRAGWWSASALLWISALHHSVIGGGALLFLSGAFWL